MESDPLAQFFPDDPDVDLYNVMGLESNASADDIKKAYRRLALQFHPDRHAGADEGRRADASIKFKQIGFAYTILSDESRRRKYDTTGSVEEGLDLDGGEGWDAYFAELFERVTKGKLDEMKKQYQGSQEELDDLEEAYHETEGSIEGILERIPHSNYADEDRFIRAINASIKAGKLTATALWKAETKDAKAKAKRRAAGEAEAAEAEEAAKELGVWDEFYGSGKPSERKGKGKRGSKDDDGEGDLASLKAIIQSRQKNASNFLDDLASKYSEADKGKGRKKRPQGKDETERPKKRPKAPDIDDAEFAALQAKLFGNKAKAQK